MRRLWVIPDTHGCSKTLQELVGENIKATRDDRLYFLGDYIDRGPDAKGVIDFIMQLQKDGFTIRMLRGNHEDFLLKVYEDQKNHRNILGIPVAGKLKKEWFKYGGKETLASFGVSDAHLIPEKYIDWIKNLDYFIELDSFLLVHAGFNFDIENPFDDRYAMLWAKDFKIIPEKVNFKKVVHGHVPVSLDFIELVKDSSAFDFIDLDNGIYKAGKEGFGNLVALELNSRELAVQANLDM
jgi:serine/threonine protein phosphatase 1